MSIMQRLQLLLSAARRRQLAASLLISLPIGVAVVVVVARLLRGTTVCLGIAIATAIACVLVIAALAFRATRRVDNAWVVRRLDQQRRDLDDSSDLLFADTTTLTTIDRMQRSRIDQRLSEEPLPDLRPVWPQRDILIALVTALLLIAIGWSLQIPATLSGVSSEAASQVAPTATATHLERVALSISPPAYTGLTARTENVLEAKFPEGSLLTWKLHFDSEPSAVALTFYDGTHLDLVRENSDWIGKRIVDKSSLYRIALTAAPPLNDDRLYRLDAIADQPPELRVIAPDKTLTLRDAMQKTWDLAFEASDDYGISAARLAITLAQGTGENITFKEQSIILTGEGDATHQRYQHSLDLTTLGINAGDDVIVRLYVSDNHASTPNETRSPSYILRWPPPTGDESSGMEGLVQKTMPAYFRSQRQLIIDTEALLAEKATIDSAHFLARSDQLGVEQKILRLRYGEFLGEEFESNTGIGGDHSDHPNSSIPASDQASAVIAEYGDMHDRAEAATLLDPETKRTLKSALSEMWQSELHLRQGEPEIALPYENRALVFLKQVQQSTRIYLARVGLELPEIDASRRLSGDRVGLRDPADALQPADADDRTVSEIWHALGDLDSRVSNTPVPDVAKLTITDFEKFDRYVRDHEKTLPDALGVLAASDAVQRDPACVSCRENLKKLLWPLLPIPASATELRTQPDVLGNAYLDALESERGKRP